MKKILLYLLLLIPFSGYSQGLFIHAAGTTIGDSAYYVPDGLEVGNTTWTVTDINRDLDSLLITINDTAYYRIIGDSLLAYTEKEFSILPGSLVNAADGIAVHTDSNKVQSITEDTDTLDWNVDGWKFEIKPVVEAGGYGDEFQAVYDAWTNVSHDSIADKLNTFAETVVASGTWAKLDVLHVYAIHTSNNSDALLNWITAADPATAVSAPVFTAFEGYVGDATADYIDWEWAPSDGVNYTQNSASIGVYIRVATYGTTKHVMGSYDNSYATFILPRSDDNEAKWYHNQGSTQTVVSNSSPTGLFILQRTASNADQLFRNKASLGTSSVVSEGRSTQDVFSLATNWDNPGAAFFCDYQIAMDFAGSALTQTDIDTITDAFETFMDSNGKGIIP